MQELSTGARHVQLWLGPDLAYAGELDKGCGNQVFDYEKTIVISKDSDLPKPGTSGASPGKHESVSASSGRTPAMDNVALFPSTDLDAIGVEDHTHSDAWTVSHSHNQDTNRKKPTGMESSRRKGGRPDRTRGQLTSRSS